MEWGSKARNAARAGFALWPALLAHEGEALGVVQQAGKVDQVGYSHERQSSSKENARSIIPPLSSHQKLVRTASHSPASQHPGTRHEPSLKGKMGIRDQVRAEPPTPSRFPTLPGLHGMFDPSLRLAADP